jgi:hypothetical protein
VCATQRWEKGGKIKEDLAQPIFLHFAVFLVHFFTIGAFQRPNSQNIWILDSFGVV